MGTISPTQQGAIEKPSTLQAANQLVARIISWLEANDVKSARQQARQNNQSRAFHQCIVENCLLSCQCSVVLPVRPRRTTGFSGRSAYRMYGFQSHCGAELWETIRHWDIFINKQLETRER